MQTRRKNCKEKTESPGADWRQCPGCQATGRAGCFCENCEDSGLTYSEECTLTVEGGVEENREPWMSRLGLMWRDGFKRKLCETLFRGMKVMIVKGPSDQFLQIGFIVNVMRKYIVMELYDEREQRLRWQKVHMHSVIVIHRGVKVTVDQNGVLFVERRTDAEIRGIAASVSDDESCKSVVVK
jgi:hypothetical protein